MNVLEEIKLWSSEFLSQEVFVVDVEFKPGSKKITVLIDCDEALTVNHCRTLNRHLSEKLDEVDYSENPYILEVSSPGIDRPLAFIRQYKKHLEREMRVVLKEGGELTGKLLSVENNEIKLLLKDNKKGYKSKEPKEKIVNFDDIKEGFVLVTFS